MFLYGQKDMSDKLKESLEYLRCCTALENESFRLFETISKKINQPESSYILGIASDSLKNARIIQGILESFDLPEQDNKTAIKELSELASEIMLLEKKISKINNLEYLISCEMLKESMKLADLLSEVYTSYLKSSLVRLIVDELSKTGLISLPNFKKIFEHFIEEKGKHKEIITETMYILEVKETETRRQITPIIKYQNPEQWIHESTIHSFSTPTATALTET
jgi:hypothetical protein